MFSELGRYRALKKTTQISLSVLVVASHRKKVTRSDNVLKTVDLVFGPQTLHRLPDMLEARRSGGAQVDISFPEIEKFDRLPEPKLEGHAYVSIMKGCSKYCTFCVVPTLGVRKSADR